MSPSPGADWGRAKVLAPAEHFNDKDWLGHWQENGDQFLRVLGDIYRVYKSEERKSKGTGDPRGGRRKSTIDGNLDELWRILTPRFSMQPFQRAFGELQGARSLRAVAQKAGVSPGTLSQWISGKNPSRRIDRHGLEQVAKALDVHPAFFLEWRVLVIQELITHVVTTNPNLSIRLLKAIS